MHERRDKNEQRVNIPTRFLLFEPTVNSSYLRPAPVFPSSLWNSTYFSRRLKCRIGYEEDVSYNKCGSMSTLQGGSEVMG